MTHFRVPEYLTDLTTDVGYLGPVQALADTTVWRQSEKVDTEPTCSIYLTGIAGVLATPYSSNHKKIPKT